MRRQVVVAGLVGALLVAGVGIAAGSASAPVSVPCSIDANTLTCPLPAPVTKTVTSTRTATVTKTVTATPTPTSTPPTSATTTPPAAGFPDASTTGPTGTLTPVGSVTASTDGQVIENVQINGCLTIKANNVTVRNVLVKSDQCFFLVLNDSGNTGLTLTDVEIDGMGKAGQTGIGGRNWTALRIDVHGTEDGLKLGDNTSITDSFVHGLVGASSAHNDGMQASDGANITVRHNTVDIALSTATSAILVKSDFGPISNVTIDSNLLAGGAWTLYAGETGNDGSAVTGVKVTNNQFSTRYWPKAGAFGPITSVPAGAVVTGNQWFDGPNAGGPVS